MLAVLLPPPASCEDGKPGRGGGRQRLLQAVDGYLALLPPIQRAAQLFLVNIDGSSDYRALEKDDGGAALVPGGCLFFSYNIAPDAEGLVAFTQSIARYCESRGLPRPYAAVDQEGGAVNRLRDVASPLPSPGLVARSMTPRQAARLYACQGAQLAALGFDLNLAPVAEARASYNEDFLANRSYGDAAAAALFSMLAVRSYQEQGVLCAAKHFPGNSNSDPHSGVSLLFGPDGLSASAQEKELSLSVYLPFLFMLAASPAAVLMSHAVVPLVDPGKPALLSRVWIEDVLRGRLGYGGLVISDDIFMGALSAFDKRTLAVRAVQSGADVLMLSDKYFKDYALALLEEAEKDPAFAARLHEAQRKVVLFKLRSGLLQAEQLSVEAAGGGPALRIAGVSLEEQRGSAAERLEAFAAAKKEGEALYRSLVQSPAIGAGGGQ